MAYLNCQSAIEGEACHFVIHHSNPQLQCTIQYTTPSINCTDYYLYVHVDCSYTGQFLLYADLIASLTVLLLTTVHRDSKSTCFPKLAASLWLLAQNPGLWLL